ncbi:MAG: hypothetical protein HY959_12290 [Ignavibacteriae bacterium]|nr:hypothetical protein [Ignavibacteriota bacterium]
MKKHSIQAFVLIIAMFIIISGCGKGKETSQTNEKAPTKTTETKTESKTETKTESQTDELFFDVSNNTGLTLVDVFVSPAEENHWGNDILPNNLFENGSTIRVTLPPEFGKTCMFDMKITDGAGGHITFTNIDACKLIKLKINSDATFDYLQTK